MLKRSGTGQYNVKQNGQRQIELWCEENQRRTGEMSFGERRAYRYTRSLTIYTVLPIL